MIAWDNYRSLVVLTGAGISVASGLGTYRGKGGLWEQSGIAPESTSEVIRRDPWAVWSFFIPLMEQIFRAQPNAGHLALAQLQKQFSGEFTLITQNVDGLHTAAGSDDVLELHGNIRHRRCSNEACKLEPYEDLNIPESLPFCKLCGEALRPDIVLFGEQIPAWQGHQAKRSLRDVELFLSIGTSGTVMPAAGYVRAAKYAQAYTVEINLEESKQFDQAFLGPAETVIARLVDSTDTLMMLGRDESRYGDFSLRCFAGAFACLSTGGDPHSPSLAFKGSRIYPNEDGLLVRQHNDLTMLALTDGHLGNQGSHHLLERLYLQAFPENPEALLRVLDQIQRPERTEQAGSTFSVCILAKNSNRCFGFSTGDSTICLVTSDEYRLLAPRNSLCFYFHLPLSAGEWQAFDLVLPTDGILLLHSDGVNECHYRNPETSIRKEHIQTLWTQVHYEPQIFTEKLMQLSLSGLLGHPGGQDNIAIVAMPLNLKSQN